MKHCWEMRGCDEEMQSRCPHNTPGESCPTECHFAVCGRPTHEMIDNPLDLLNPDLNFDAAVKETCRMCKFFHAHGPAWTEADAAVRPGNPNRFLL